MSGVRRCLLHSRHSLPTFVFGPAQQPRLVVNDLKLGESHGQVAIFSASDTEPVFRTCPFKSVKSGHRSGMYLT